MNFKEWMQFFARLKPEECREMGNLLIGLANEGSRDAARETAMREAIASLPDDNSKTLSKDMPA